MKTTHRKAHRVRARAGARGIRRIAVVTGTRAEYGLLMSTLRAIAADPRLELQLVVSGMHLLRKFGHTVDEIARDGWPLDARVPMQTGTDGNGDQAAGLARRRPRLPLARRRENPARVGAHRDLAVVALLKHASLGRGHPAEPQIPVFLDDAHLAAVRA